MRVAVDAPTLSTLRDMVLLCYNARFWSRVCFAWRYRRFMCLYLRMAIFLERAEQFLKHSAHEKNDTVVYSGRCAVRVCILNLESGFNICHAIAEAFGLRGCGSLGRGTRTVAVSKMNWYRLSS